MDHDIGHDQVEDQFVQDTASRHQRFEKSFDFQNPDLNHNVRYDSRSNVSMFGLAPSHAVENHSTNRVHHERTRRF